jgi:penicillin-binding protein 2
MGYWVLSIALIACSSLTPVPTLTPPPPTPTLTTPDPEGTATTFLDAWVKGDYTAMYSLLSPLSQDAISLADFTARYESVARVSTLKSLEAKILNVLKSGARAQASYIVTFHTAVVGDIPRQTEMPLVYENGRWQISWTDAMILPELKDGGTLVMDYAKPARANIYDREGLGLAVQGQGKIVIVGVQPGLIKDESAVLTALSNLLGVQPGVLKDKYAAVPADWYVPLGEASAADVQANYATLAALAGVFMTASNTRDYPFNGVAAHVVGYMGAIPPEQLATYEANGYTGDERVGIGGLEAWGEPYLAGQRGGKLRVVSPGGQTTGLAESQPQPAQAIYTTLDRAFQMAVQDALGNFHGAAIVLNPETGEILALASNPTFDPNVFEAAGRDANALAAILDDPHKPLLNRATQGTYPPGSVFKVPMMGAALMSGLYTRNTIYNCTGKWDLLGPSAIKYDWTVTFGVKPHGKIDLVQSLAFSCDTYYYTVAYNLYQQNPDYMSQVARQFGLGEFTQIGQVAEAKGLIPDPAWKLSAYGEPWTPGDSVNMGIGQGYVLVTPLQIAQMMAAIRNGGTLYRPQIVQRIAPPDGAASFQFQPIVNGKLPLTAEQLALIQEGLQDVTTLPRGTARQRFLGLEVPVAGKTGTAEDPGAGGAPHAWFAGYTQANRQDKPDIVIVVVVENIGEGAEYAAPIFRRIVEIYFKGRAYTLYPWETEFGGEATPTPTP